MKNLVIILVLLFSSLSFSQKVLTPKNFPVKITLFKGNTTMFIPTNEPIELTIHKVLKNGSKDLIDEGKYNMAFETSFPLEKGRYIIKVIKNKKIYINKFFIK